MRYLNIFQFHYGSIRTNNAYEVLKDYPELSIPLWFNQNTYDNKHINRFEKVFQFHYGSIRTIIFLSCFLSSIRFQFHYGSIRTLIQSLTMRPFIMLSIPLWFNQNIASLVPHSFYSNFQFHYGSIRTTYSDFALMLETMSFNSIMVQLELHV